MDPRTAAPTSPDPDAVEFVRFCYRRRRVGWPELYDEMCAVANRGLFRGYGCDDLAARGVAFGLFDMPRLAAMTMRIVEEEKAARRAVPVMIRPAATDALAAQTETGAPAPTPVGPQASPSVPARATVHQIDERRHRSDAPSTPFVRVAVPAGA